MDTNKALKTLSEYNTTCMTEILVLKSEVLDLKKVINNLYHFIVYETEASEALGCSEIGVKGLPFDIEE